MNAHSGRQILDTWQFRGGYSHLCKAWCPLCLVYHAHGAGDGPRVPHCPDGRGYNTASGNEYFVKIVGHAPAGAIDWEAWAAKSPNELGLAKP